METKILIQITSCFWTNHQYPTLGFPICDKSSLLRKLHGEKIPSLHPTNNYILINYWLKKRDSPLKFKQGVIKIEFKN
jgi:hypothetical protein